MSAATLEYARPTFEERQRLHVGRGMGVFLCAIALIGIAGYAVLFQLSHGQIIGAAAGMILVAAAVIVLIPFFVMPAMTTRVDGEGLHVRFGVMPWRTITAGSIAAVEPCTYDARKDFGGWGMRLRVRGRNDCYTIGGNEGVWLTLLHGQRVLVGSERRDELATAIRSLIGKPASTSADTVATQTE